MAELSDVELRKTLIKHGLIVGPVTSKCNRVRRGRRSRIRFPTDQTRSIYQRKLLEVLTDERTEGTHAT